MNRAPAQPVTYPRERRGALDCELAAELRDGLRDEGVSHEAAAAALAVSRQKVDDYANPGARENAPRLRAFELALLAGVAPETVRRILRRALEALRDGLVPLPSATRSTRALMPARVARETTEVVAETIEASAAAGDGGEDWTVAEAAKIDSGCTDAIAALLEVQAESRRVIAAGRVVPIGRGRR